jgi:uncharacterized protein YndB with AHSA1/START domain
MTIFFIILGIVLGLPVIVLLIALFSKKNYSISRSIVIEKPTPLVFDYIKNIKNQDQFSKWVMTDPLMAKNYTGTDGTEGFIYQWDSKNKQAGAGEQEIKRIVPNQHLDLEVRFLRPFKAVAKTPFSTESISENQTKVTWGMHSTMPYPLNALLLFMNMEKLLGKDMDVSLQNLKVIMEECN